MPGIPMAKKAACQPHSDAAHPPTSEPVSKPAGVPSMMSETVEALREGDAALAFDGEGSLVLEARSHQPPPA